MAMVTTAYLRRLGCDVVVAGTMFEAVDKLDRQHFDLAVLDLGLPDSSPDETVSRFREAAGPVIPFVVLTGSAGDKIKASALAQGGITVVEKGKHQEEGLRAAWECAREYATRHHTLTASMLERVEKFLSAT